MDVEHFWRPWEKRVRSFDGAIKAIHEVFDRRQAAQRTMIAWRGQVNADWPLHSSLYRLLAPPPTSAEEMPDEEKLYNKEKEILDTVHRWGLHVGHQGRLGILPQLAVLQHYGAPTRLIDVTFNPLIGLWFAVEEKWDNGAPQYEDEDGRLFAIDVTKRLINEDNEKRLWEDEFRWPPWPSPEPDVTDDLAEHDEKLRRWQTSVYAWRPSRLDGRIAAQNGGFVFGGVPSWSGPGGRSMQWRKKTNPVRYWSIDEVRECTSLAMHVNKFNRKSRGRNPKHAMYTLRINAKAKASIRKKLQDLYGYEHSTIYPDYTGFAKFGVPPH